MSAHVLSLNYMRKACTVVIYISRPDQHLGEDLDKHADAFMSQCMVPDGNARLEKSQIELECKSGVRHETSRLPPSLFFHRVGHQWK